jgi:hypothetical protein
VVTIMPLDAEDREYMKAAILQADIVNEDDERWQHERTKQRSGVALHYRTQENALIQKNDAEPTLDAVLGDFADAIGSELGAIAREERARSDAEIARLEAEIASLRADVEAMQQRKAGVVPILRGRGDVA